MARHIWHWELTRMGNRLALHPGARRFIVTAPPGSPMRCRAHAIDGDDEAGGAIDVEFHELGQLVRNIELDAECKAAELARMWWNRP